MNFLKPKIYLIAAADRKGGIGLKGKLPWRLPGDLAFFQKKTTKTNATTKLNLVVMGRNTWESIPKEHRPLSGRLNAVLSHKADFKAEDAKVYPSLVAALKSVTDDVESIYIIGGGQVFREAMRLSDLAGVYLTRVHGDYHCDTFFPELPKRLHKKELLGHGEENGVKYEFWYYGK